MATTFLEMPRSVYRDDPCWVPPLTFGARRFMSPKRNPYFREAEIDHFIATDGRGRCVGRISATIDPEYVARYGEVGFFGWFEAVDDADVAAALLKEAENWAGQRGMKRLAGPYSYCSTQEFGLLVKGYDTPPAAFQPHNPPYYAELLSAAGYRESFHTNTYRWSAERDAAALRRVVERGDAACNRHGLAVRSLNPARWEAEMGIIHDLFTASFADNHEVVPMSRRVFDFQAGELKGFLDPRLARFVEHDGRPVGFSLLMADANEVLAVARGRLSPSFLVRYPYLRRNVTGAVVLMIGASPGAGGIGVGRVLAAEVARVALGRVGGYRRVHTTWIHQDNWQSRAIVTRTGAAPVRTYAVYEKELQA